MKTSHAQNLLAAALVGALAFTTTLRAQETATDDKAAAAEFTKKLANPVASLISVPFQNNWDFGIGPSDAMKYTMNFMVTQLLKVGKQPVQFSLGAKYYAEGPKGGPDWGLRFAVTFLFPN